MHALRPSIPWIICLLAATMWSACAPSPANVSSEVEAPAIVADTTALAMPNHTDPDEMWETYQTNLKALEKERLEFHQKLGAAGSEAAKDSIFKQVHQHLQQTLIEQILPAWYGTPWDYNGYTDKPREGEIACGYFVSTPLRHCNFKVNRFKLAQQYSFDIIKTLCGSDGVQRIGHNDLNRVLEYVAERPDDIYVMGLDNHVGWLARYQGQTWFIHSNFVDEVHVEPELAGDSRVLAGSENYVFGSLLTNRALLEKWLAGTTIPVSTQ